MSAKSRAKSIRRDRRKAKASGWKRAGRVRWGTRAAHGSVGVGSVGTVGEAPAVRQLQPADYATKPRPASVRRQLGNVVLK